MSQTTSYLIVWLFSLPLTVVGCADIPTTHNLRPTSWIPANAQLLKQPVDLKNCLDEEQHFIPNDFAIEGIGIILHPNISGVRTQSWEELLEEHVGPTQPVFKANQVGISVIPYVIDKSEQKFMLIPKLATDEQPFNKFAPACQAGWNGLSEVIFKMPYYYPTVVVTVTSQQRNNFIEFLKEKRPPDCQFGEFTATPITPSQSVHNKPLEFLLQEVFDKQEALFLHTFADAQEVILAEAQIQFQVGKPSGSVAATTSPTLLQAETIQIQFNWPKILGKLVITGCEEAQENESEYATTCSFTVGHTYHISRPTLSKPTEVILTWQEDLGQLIIPTCQTPLATSVGYRSTCAFQTGKSYRITPPFHNASTSLAEPERKLIVISLSADFNGEGTGKIIQDSLYHVFKQYNSSYSPFSLLAISSGRQLSDPILHSEQLPTLIAENNSDMLKERIKQLQFSATDLNALDDLELVDSYISNHKLSISEIVYLTDNMGILTQPPRKQLGIPLAWHQEGIQLTVLTTQDCAIWIERANARCTTWQGKQQQTLEKFLTFYYPK